MKFKPGDRVVIIRGHGTGHAGTVCAPRPGDQMEDAVRVQFDRAAGREYWVQVAALDHEAIPKKPPRPSVRRSTQQWRRRR